MFDSTEELVDGIRQEGLESAVNRYYSVYRGKVTDNKDPKKIGRVKLKVPTLFGEQEHPGWAMPRDFRNTRKSGGEFYPPEIEDWVYVEFMDGDTRFPLYSGGWAGEEELHADFEFGEGDVPNVRGFRDPLGSKLLFVQTPDKRKVTLKVTDGGAEEAGHTVTLDCTKEKEQVSVMTKGGHYLVMDDTKDKEAIYLAHKAGSQIQISPKGTVQIFTKDGNYVALDAEAGAVTVGSKDGSIVSLKDNIVLTDASGKSVVSMGKESVQIMTGGDAIIQANTATVNSGSFAVDTKVAKLAMGNGKLALGTPAIELVDGIIQLIDALLKDPAICMTPSGPSSGFIGTAKVQMTALKVKFNLLKGSLP